MEEPLQTEIISFTESTGDQMVYSQDRALVDTQIATAKAYPRNLSRVIEDAIAIVTMDEATAQSCNYTLPRGDKQISGVTIHCAMIIAQQFGNLKTGSRIVGFDDKYVTSQAIAYDLQKNLLVTTEVKRLILQNEWVYDPKVQKNVKTGKMIRMNDDMITMTGNAANAISLRNAILRVIPRQVVDKVYNAAKATITGDISDEVKFTAKRIEIFARLLDDYKVTEEEALKCLGKASVANLTREDLVALLGIMQAMKDGDTTADFAFRSGRTSTNAIDPELQAKRNAEKKTFLVKLFDELKEDLVEEDKVNIGAIITEERFKSYTKAIDYLKELKLKKDQAKNDTKQKPNRTTNKQQSAPSNRRGKK